MSPGDISTILQRLTDQDEKQTLMLKRLDDQDRQSALLRADLQEVKRDVKDLGVRTGKIEEQTTATNGRVGKLETAKQVQEAVELRDHQEAEQRKSDQVRDVSERNSRLTAWQGAGLGSVGMLAAYLVLHLIETGKL